MPPVEPIRPMDVEGIWKQGIAQLWAMAEKQTENMVAWYRKAHEAWCMVYTLKSYDSAKTVTQAGPMPEPPLSYTLDNKQPKFLEYPAVVLGTDRACEPLPLPKAPNYEPVPGATIFGEFMWSWPREAYQASSPEGMSDGPVGRKVERDGKTFVLRQKGKGTVFQLLFWEIAA